MLDICILQKCNQKPAAKLLLAPGAFAKYAHTGGELNPLVFSARPARFCIILKKSGCCGCSLSLALSRTATF
jgi:hypothetical protein